MTKLSPGGQRHEQKIPQVAVFRGSQLSRTALKADLALVKHHEASMRALSFGEGPDSQEAVVKHGLVSRHVEGVTNLMCHHD